MIDRFNTPLEAKVGARNAANKLANELSPAIFKALQSFVGVKCFNQGSAIGEKLREALPVLPNTVEAALAYYSTGHGYSLSVTFKASTIYTDRTGLHCNTSYAEETVYLADIDRQGLTISKIYEQVVRRTDFTKEEVMLARLKLREAQRHVSQAQSRLIHFGEHDNF